MRRPITILAASFFLSRPEVAVTDPVGSEPRESPGREWRRDGTVGRIPAGIRRLSAGRRHRASHEPGDAQLEDTATAWKQRLGDRRPWDKLSQEAWPGFRSWLWSRWCRPPW